MSEQELAAWCKRRGCRYVLNETAPGSIDVIFPGLIGEQAVADLKSRLYVFQVAALLTIRSEIN